MEIEYYTVGKYYGWNQSKFRDPVMRIGGCAAVTACDSCIYFSKFFGMNKLYPFDSGNITSKEYRIFAGTMKKYLHPRIQGIDKTEIYIDGMNAYLKDKGEERIKISALSGEAHYKKAKETVINRIDRRIPLPCLTLKHKDKKFEDFTWHWFMITGYKQTNDGFFAKAVSYGEWIWLDFDALWDTGYEQKGGLVIFEVDK